MTDKPRLIEWAKQLADDIMHDGAQLVQMGSEIERQAKVYASLLTLAEESTDGAREALMRQARRERRHLHDLMERARTFRNRGR